MIRRYFRLLVELGDWDFNQVYPAKIRSLAARHFTPIDVARRAATYLAPHEGTKVLDIGSGAGKFCMVAAVTTDGVFTGVEYREPLVKISTKIAAACKIPNVEFRNSNITEVRFSDFDAFYFFNSFYENIEQSARIDDSVEVDRGKYLNYSHYVRGELATAPRGTRLATYWSCFHEVPKSYKEIARECNGMLRFWEKR